MLLLIGGCDNGAAPVGLAADRGAGLYATSCLACHQRDGTGIAHAQPPLAGTEVTGGDPEQLLAWVMFGEWPAALPNGRYAGLMPQFAYLADADLAAILTYVRASFGNHAAPVTPAMVSKARAVRRARSDPRGT